MAEWLKAADCKSVGYTLRWFESNSLYTCMGFFTIWVCLFSLYIRVVLPFIRGYIPFNKKQVKTNWYLLAYTYRSISRFIFALISFNYSEFFIYFFIENAKTPFFITDSNNLAYHLFQNILFFAWIAYFPFIFYIFFFILKASLLNIANYSLFRISFVLVYLHFLSVIVTHFDTFSFLQSYFNSNIGFWFERVDYSSHLIQYRGAFFDISYSLIFFWLNYFIFIEYFPKMIYARYTPVQQDKAIRNFWNVFYFFWCFRIFAFLFVFYFFTGEGFFSDVLVAVFTMVFNELFIIVIRIAFILFSFKELLCEYKYDFFY